MPDQAFDQESRRMTQAQVSAQRQATQVSTPCWDFCAGTDFDPDGLCNVSGCVPPSDTVRRGDGTEVFVYEDTPMAHGLFIDFDGAPTDIQLSINYEWLVDGVTFIKGVTGHDQIQSAPDGRAWGWWHWKFWLSDLADDKVGRDITFKAEIEEQVSNLTDSHDLNLQQQAMRLQGRPDATILSVDVE